MRCVKIPHWLCLLILAACSDEGETPPPTPDGRANERVVLREEPLRLERLTSFKDFGVTPSKTSTTTLLLRAEVTPPVLGGGPLYSTAISVSAPYAFVAYSTPGADFGGAIDVIDVSDLSAPVLVSSVSLPDADVLSADSDGTRLFVALGGESFGFDETAAIRAYPLAAGVIDTAGASTVPLPSAVATDVLVEAGSVYVTTGRVDGRLVQLDAATLAVTASVAVEDARSVALEAGTLAVHAGDRVETFDAATLASQGVYAFMRANDNDARSEVAFRGGKLFVTAGSEGVHVMDSTDGSLLETISVPAIDGVDSSEVVANGVASVFDVLFIAQGAGGFNLAASDRDPSGLAAGLVDPFDGLARVAFSDWQSSNAVANTSEAVIVANGVGGTRIIALDNLASTSVTLSSPQFSASLTSPTASVALSADVVGAPIPIQKVEFYAGTGKLGEDDTPPYELVVTDLAGAYYDFSARAIFEGDYAKTSTSHHVTLEGVFERVNFGRETDPDELRSTPATFYTAEGDLPPGYVRDVGDVYGPRGSGISFGWSADRTSRLRMSENRMLGDRRYFETIQLRDNGTQWEIEVPNGVYDVTAVAGRNHWRFRETTLEMQAEGVAFFNDTTTQASFFIERELTGVSVADGRFTLEKISGDSSAEIAFVEVRSSGGVDYQPPSAPTGLSAVQTHSHSTLLYWTPSDDNVSVDAYEVYVDGVSRVVADGPRAFIGALSPGTEYTFEVEALDPEGNRSARASLNLTTPTDDFLNAQETFFPITVDGVASETNWMRTVVHPITTSIEDDNPTLADISGELRALWDATHLYLFLDITDDDVSDDDLIADGTGATQSSDDAFEVYFDLRNNRQLGYDSDDIQLVFSVGASQSAENDLDDDGVTRTFSTASGHFQTVTTATGWAAELALPWSVLDPGGVFTPSTDVQLGFELMLMDDDAGGGRDSKLAWSEEMHSGSWTTSQRMSTMVLATP